MCQNTSSKKATKKSIVDSKHTGIAEDSSSSPQPPKSHTMSKKDEQSTALPRQRHRGKRESSADYHAAVSPSPSESSAFVRKKVKAKRQSKSLQKHASDSPSGGVEALLPSLIGVAILVCSVMAKMGFRGRAEVAGIDLGTTNSVVCVQRPSKGVGVIDCIRDPATNSSIVPSVVSFLDPSERPVGPKSKTPSNLYPHPSQVVVGHAAKRRINTHPHHTLYNAKRVLGRASNDQSIQELQGEVEFNIIPATSIHQEEASDEDPGVFFRVPHHEHAHQASSWLSLSPQQVGAYVVDHLMQITKEQLGHENVKAAVICVPAKFNAQQRQLTVNAFQQAGVKVTRILEEPTSAALAYGLHKKEHVDYILVYDFGGGTLDVSLLHVSEGFVDVMGSDGDDRLGGADFDAAVAHFLLESHGGQDMVDPIMAVMKQLEHALEITNVGLDLEEEFAAHCPAIRTRPLCTISSFHTIGEQLKIALSDALAKTEAGEANGDDSGSVQAQCLRLPDGVTNIPEQDDKLAMLDAFCQSLVPTALSISHDEYNQVVQSLLARSILPVERLLQDLNLKTGEIDEVVMVGGSTRMPQIRALVRGALPQSQLNTHIDPDITVAYGAASVID